MAFRRCLRPTLSVVSSLGISYFPKMSQVERKKRVCIFAANEHCEKKQRDKGKVPNLKECRFRTHLICRNCGTAACRGCVELILKAIPLKEQCVDGWSQFLSDNLTSLKKKDVYINIGHCCEIKKQAKMKLAPAKRQLGDTQAPKKSSAPAPKNTSNSKSKRKKLRAKRKNWKASTGEVSQKYSGYMHFLGADLIVDSPKCGDVDIHGMGTVGEKKENNFVHGIMHCVLSTETCKRLFSNGIVGRSFDSIRERNDVEVVNNVVEVETGYGVSRSF